MSLRRRQKKIFRRHEIQQGLGSRPGAPWVAISGVYKAAYNTCTSSRLLNQPLLGFFFNFCFLLLFYVLLRSRLFSIVKSRRKGFELEPWFLPRFPAHFIPTGVFSGRFFLASVQTAFALLAVA